MTVAILAIAAFLAQRSRVRVAYGVEQSLALLPTLCAAVLFGSLAALVVGAVSMLAEFRVPYLKWSVYSCTRALNGAAMGAVASVAREFTHASLAGISVAAVLAALSAEVGDVSFAALTFRVRRKAVGPMLAGLVPLTAMAVPFYGTTIVLLALAYRNISPWTLPLFLLPALGVQRLFVLYQDQRSYASKLIAANERLRLASLSFAAAMVSALDARDSYTAGHSAAVAIYARDIACELGLSSGDQDLAYQCGLVHDIGKIGLPAGLIEKTGPLSFEERITMESHSEIGESMLSRIEEFSAIARIVRHHHERFDGTGYPDGVMGADIPLQSRILAVADAYNAMTSDRPYRDALSSIAACARLCDGSRTQFDPVVVTAFESVLNQRSESYRYGRDSVFVHDQRLPLAWQVHLGAISPEYARASA